MKTFDQLTKEQQTEAYLFAEMKLKEAVQDDLFGFELNGIGQEQIDSWAKEIAENAVYDDDGTPYVEEMDVPYSFQGGCV